MVAVHNHSSLDSQHMAVYMLAVRYPVVLMTPDKKEQDIGEYYLQVSMCVAHSNTLMCQLYLQKRHTYSFSGDNEVHPYQL